MKSGIATDWLTALRKYKNDSRDMLKHYKQTMDSGNQKTLLPITSAGNLDLNDTLFETGIGVKANQMLKRTLMSLLGSPIHTKTEKATIAFIKKSQYLRVRARELKS